MEVRLFDEADDAAAGDAVVIRHIRTAVVRVALFAFAVAVTAAAAATAPDRPRCDDWRW